MTPVSHGSAFTHKVLCVPGHDVRLPRRDFGAACRTQIVLLGTVRGNIAHKPFRPAVGLLASPAIGQASYIGGRVLRGPLILVNPAIARH